MGLGPIGAEMSAVGSVSRHPWSDAGQQEIWNGRDVQSAFADDPAGRNEHTRDQNNSPAKESSKMGLSCASADGPSVAEVAGDR